MLTFTIAIFFLLITPGPGVLSLAGVGAAFGYRPGWAYGTGLFLGSNAVMLAAATGLAAIFFADERTRIVFTILSTGYLLYLASRVAFAGSKVGFIAAEKPPGIWGGITLQIINPKAYAVGTFVFSNFPFWPDSLVFEASLKFLLLNAVWIPIHILWLGAGVSLQRMQLSPVVQQRINRTMALMMVVVVGLAVWTSFYNR